MPLYEKLRSFFHWKYSGVFIFFFWSGAFVMLSFAPSVDSPRPLLILAYLFLIAGFIWSIGYWVTCGFLHKKNPKYWKPKKLKKVTEWQKKSYSIWKYSVGVLIICFFIASIFLSHWIGNEIEIKDTKTGRMFSEILERLRIIKLSDPGEEQRVKELLAIDKLFGNKNETALRDMFGFHQMVKLNVGMIADKITHMQQTGSKNFDLTPYIKGREMLLDTEIAGSHLQHRGGGGVYDPAPDEVALIVLPEKYTQGKRLLLSYENSSLLPHSVTKAIKEYDDTITKNTKLLMKTMDTALKENPEYYLQYDNTKSPYWQAINGAYVKKFLPLRPKADKIRDSIRSVLLKEES